jgi:hypothetical protein
MSDAMRNERGWHAVDDLRIALYEYQPAEGGYRSSIEAFLRRAISRFYAQDKAGVVSQ